MIKHKFLFPHYHLEARARLLFLFLFVLSETTELYAFEKQEHFSAGFPPSHTLRSNDPLLHETSVSTRRGEVLSDYRNINKFGNSYLLHPRNTWHKTNLSFAQPARLKLNKMHIINANSLTNNIPRETRTVEFRTRKMPPIPIFKNNVQYRSLPSLLKEEPSNMLVSNPNNRHPVTSSYAQMIIYDRHLSNGSSASHQLNSPLDNNISRKDLSNASNSQYLTHRYHPNLNEEDQRGDHTQFNSPTWFSAKSDKKPPPFDKNVPYIPAPVRSGAKRPPPITRRPAAMLDLLSQMLEEDVPTDLEVSNTLIK